MSGNEDTVIRIDISEYQEEHSIARLIGAPPGYVGYDEGGQLTEAVRRHPYSVVLLDEIEKAHPSVFNTLLQVFDDGRLTDGQGRVVDFKNTIIIMTSNLGSETIREHAGDKDTAFVKDEIDRLLHKAFRPEFLNRLSSYVIYNPLTHEVVDKIVQIQLTGVAKRLKEKDIKLTVSPMAKQYLTDKGFDPIFGARPLKRLIDNEILDEIAFKVIEGTIGEGDEVMVDTKENKIDIEVKYKN